MAWAKPLAAAALVLAVLAGALLAVALPDPAPAAAQTSTTQTDTPEITMINAATAAANALVGRSFTVSGTSEANADITATLGSGASQVSADADADASGVWSLSFALDNGHFTPDPNSPSSAQTLSVKAEVSGESESAAATLALRVDSTNPTVTIVANPVAPRTEGQSLVTFTVSEPVTGFLFSEVDHSGDGGTLVATSFPTSGITYTATFTAGIVAGRTFTVSVPANAFTDSAGNSNDATASPATITVSKPAFSYDFRNGSAAEFASDRNHDINFTFRTNSGGCLRLGLNGRTFTVPANTTATIKLPSVNQGLCVWNIRAAPASDIGCTLDKTDAPALTFSHTTIFTGGSLFTSSATCPVVSATPTLALAPGQDTGSATDDGIISDSEPSFRVANVVANSALRLAATHTSTGRQVARVIEGGITTTSVDVDFSGNNCYVNTGPSPDQPCALADGAWSVLATHYETGKDTSSSTALSITVDTTPPTATITSSAAVLAVGATATATIEFSEPVPNLALGTVTQSASSVAALSNLTDVAGSNNRRYTATITAAAANATPATFVLAAGSITDAAGNNSATASNTLSITVQAATDLPVITAPADNATLDKTFTVAGTAEAEASVSVAVGPVGSAVTRTTMAHATSGAWSVDFALAEASLTGSQTISVVATASGENPSPPQTITATFDTTAPTATITALVTSLDVGGTTTATFTFSEAITTLALGAITQSNTSVAELTNLTAGANNTYTATITAAASGAASFTLAAGSFTDSAGNSNLAGANLTLQVQVSDSTPATDQPAITAPAANASLGKTFTVSGTAEAGASVSVSVGPVGSAVTQTTTAHATSGAWSVDFTLAEASLTGSQTISVVATVSGENPSAPVTRQVTIDSTAPTATITAPVGSLQVGATTTATFTFSEPIATLALSAITQSNTSVAELTALTAGANNTYTATVTAKALGTASFTLAAGSFTDSAGSSNLAPVSLTLQVLTAANMPAISTPAANALVGRNFEVTGMAQPGAVVWLMLGSGQQSVTQRTTAVASGAWSASFALPNGHFSSNQASAQNLTVVAITEGSWLVAPPRPLMVDATNPTVTVTAAPASIRTEGHSTVTFAVSEPVTGFEFSEVTQIGAQGSLAAASFPASGASYTATYTASHILDSQFMVSVPAGVFADAAGNLNDASPNPATITTTRPGAFFDVRNTSATTRPNQSQHDIVFTFAAATDSQCRNVVPDQTSYTVAAGQTASIKMPVRFCNWTVTASAPPYPSCSLAPASFNFTIGHTGSVTSGSSLFASALTCTQLASLPPIVALAPASDTGSSNTDAVTNATELVFKVTDVVPGASVRVNATALAGGAMVSRIAQVTSGTSVDVAFTGNNCYLNNGQAPNQPCALWEGRWSVVAIHFEPNKARSGSNTLTVSIDRTVPTAALSTTAAVLAVGDTATVTLELSEAVGSLTLSDLTQSATSVASLSNFAAVANSHNYTATLTAHGAGAASFSLAAAGLTDTAGNSNAIPATLGVTVTDPAQAATATPTITAPAANATVGSSVTVSGAAANNASVRVTLGQLSQSVTAGSSGSWSATFDASALAGSQQIIAVATASGSNPSAPARRTVTLDTTAPTIAIASSDLNLGVGITQTITFQATEAISGFALSDLTQSDTSVAELTALTAGANNSYTATLTTKAVGRATFVVPAGVITDSHGNTSTAASNTLAVRVRQVTALPTITAPADGATVGRSVTIRGTAAANAVLAVRVGSVTAPEITANSSGAWSVTLDVSSLTGSQLVSVAATAPGQQPSASVRLGVQVDSAAPRLTITVADGSLDINDTTTVTFTPTEAITGFTLSDVSQLNTAIGELSNFAAVANSNNYTATLTAKTAGVATFTLAPGAFTDAAGNQNLTSARLAVPVADPAITTTTDAPVITAPAVGATVGRTFTVRGTAEANSSVLVVLGSILANVTANSSGAWTANLDTSTIHVTASPARGNLIVLATAAGENPSGARVLNILVDNIAPTVTLTLPPANWQPGGEATLSLRVSEAVTGFALADVTQSDPAVASLSEFKLEAGSNGRLYTATLTANAQGKASFMVPAGRFTDTSGSSNVASNIIEITVGTLTDPPVITTPLAGAVVGRQVTVAGTAEPRALVTITLQGTSVSWSAFADADGNWTASLDVSSLSGSRNLWVTATAEGEFRSGGTQRSIVIDNVPPTVTLGTPSAVLDAGGTATLTFTASEPLRGLALADVIQSAPSVAALSGLTVAANNPRQYTATITAHSAGTASFTLPAGRYTDAAGNPNTAASNTVSLTVTPTTRRPAITAPAANATLGRSFMVTGTAEASSSVTVTIGSGAAAVTQTATAHATNRTWSVSFTLPQDSLNGNQTISAVATTAGSNPSLPTTRQVTLDTVSPTVAATISDATLALNETATVTFNFSEPPTGFALADLGSISHVTLGTLTPTPNNPRQYTVTVTAASPGIAKLAVPAASFTDAAGNANVAASNTLGITVTNPALTATDTPTITDPAANASLGRSFTVSGTAVAGAEVAVIVGPFSGGTGPGLTIASATAHATSGAWSANLTLPNGSLTGSRSIAAIATNSGENPSAPVTRQATFDSTAPTLAITAPQPALAVGDTMQVTFSFSEPVSGFTLAKINQSDTTKASLSAFSGSAASYTATLTAHALGATTLSVPAGRFTDAAGNAALAASQLTVPVQTVTDAPTIATPTANAQVGRVFTASGTAEANSSVAVTVGVGRNAATETVRASAGGAWETAFELAPGSLTGSLTLSAVAQAAGEIPSPAATRTISVDSTPPTVTVTSSKPTVTLRGETEADAQATLTFTFSEPPSNFELADLGALSHVTLGTLTVNPSNSRQYTLEVTAASEGFDLITLAPGAFTDAAGNPSAAPSNIVLLRVTDDVITATVDTPTVEAPVTNAVVGRVFAVSGLAEPGSTVTVVLGSWHQTAIAAGSGAWSVEFEVPDGAFELDRNSAASTQRLTVGAAVGNTNPSLLLSHTIKVDSDAPQLVSLELPSGLTEFTAGESARLTFNFSENVENFDPDDIVLEPASGVLSKARAVTLVTGPNGLSQDDVHGLVVSGANPRGGTVTVTVPAGSFADFNGNVNLEASEPFTIEVLPSSAWPQITFPAPSQLVGRTFTMRGTAEPNAAISLTLGSGAAAVPKTATANANGDWSVDFALDEGHFSEAAQPLTARVTTPGKPRSPVFARTVLVDTTSPQFSSIELSTGQANLDVTDTATVTFTASEPISGFDQVGDITNSDSSVATLGSFATGQGTSYTVEVTAAGAGTANFEVPAGTFTDAAGNPNIEVGSFSVTVNDPGASATPAVALHTNSDTGTKGDLKTNNPQPTFTVSQVAANATVTATVTSADGNTTVAKQATVGSSASSVHVTFSGNDCDTDADDTYAETCPALAAGSWSVSATHKDGVKALATSSAIEITLDLTAPSFSSIALSTGQSNLQITDTATVTFTLSEPVLGFAASDVELSPASGVVSSAAALGGSGDTYTLVVTATGATAGANTATLTVPAGALTDEAGNPSATAGTVTITVELPGASSTPTVVLHADTDSAALGDRITNDRNLKFTVSQVAANAAVVVEAVQGNTKVAKQVTVGSSATSVTVELSGNDCDIDDDGFYEDACPALAGGNWQITASHKDGFKTLATSSAITVNVDFAAPVITPAAPDPATGKVRSREFSATDDDSAATTWRSRIQTGSCAASPPAQAVAYTEGDPVTATQENQNNSYVCFWSTDVAGNTGLARSAQILDIDRTAPTIALSVNQLSFDEGQSVTITFTPSEPITGFDASDVKLSATGIVNAPRQADFTTLQNGSYTLVLTGESPGRVTVSVDPNRFTDVAGNPNTTASSSLTLIVNEVVLARTGTPSITSPSGTSPLRGTQTVSGTAEAGATVTATLGSLSAPLATATGGTWSVSFNTASLTDGSHQLSVTALASGKATSLAAQRTLTIDNTAPVVTITQQPAGGVARSKSVTATASDANAVSSFGYQLSSSSVCPFSPSGLTAYVSGSPVTLNESANNMYVCFYATDAAGNTGQAVSQLVSGIDATAPTVTITSQPAAGVAASKSVTATASDANTITAFGYRFHNSNVCPFSPSGLTAYVSGSPVTLNESANNMYVCFYATDAAGNTGQAVSQLVSGIDSSVPQVTITQQPAPGAARSKSVTAQVNDAGNIASFGYLLHSSNVCPTSPSGLTTYTSGSPVTLGESANNMYVCFYATDAAGNTGQAVSQLVFGIDDTAPTVAVTQQPATGAARSKSVTATASDNAAVASFGYLLHSTSACPASPVGLTTHTSGSPVTLGESANNQYVCFYATDAAGNTGQAVSQQVSGIDATAPTVTITEQPASGVAQSKSVTASASDASAITSFGYQLSSSSFCPPSPSGLTASTSGTPVELTTENANNMYVCFYATDAAGNTGQAVSQQVSGIDTTAPQLTLAIDQTSLIVNRTTTLRLTATETIADFDLSDFTQLDATVASLSNLSGSGRFYTATVTAHREGSASFSVAASRFTDVAGNSNTQPSNTVSVVADLEITNTPRISTPGTNDYVAGSFTLTGTAEPNATLNVTVTAAGQTPVTASPAPTADSQGRFSATLDVARLDGHTATISVAATAPGKKLSQAATRSVRVDIPVTDLKLNNITSATSAHSPTTRRVVQLTPASGSCSPDPSQPNPFTLAAGGSSASAANSATSKTFALGVTDCSWNLNFQNTADDCIVAAQFKDASGAAVGEPNTTGLLTIYVVARRLRTANRAGAPEFTSIEFTVRESCDTYFTATLSLSVTDELEEPVSDRDHTGTVLEVRLDPANTGSSAPAIHCSSNQRAQLTLASGNTATATVTGLIDIPAGESQGCVYQLRLASVRSRTNDRVLLVPDVSAGSSPTVSAATPRASLAYLAEEIVEPPVVFAVSVSSASPVTEGQPLLFPLNLPYPAEQEVVVSYSIGEASSVGVFANVSGGAGSAPSVGAAIATGTATIAAGQSSGVLSVATDDDQLDEADQTLRVTLTSATGGALIDEFSRAANGIVRDNDSAPTVGIAEASITANRLQATLELSAPSGRDTRVSYTTSIGVSGNALIRAGQRTFGINQAFDRTVLAGVESVRLRLTSAQNLTLDLHNRERVLFPGGGAWQFLVLPRDGFTAAQLAAALELGDSWQLYSWQTAVQRWQEHSAANAASVRLASGVTITYRGAPPASELLAAAELEPAANAAVTLRQGWNIFTPDPAAVGITSSDFTQTAAGDSAVIFDPRLIDCDRLAGLLVIYTYDQSDPQAQNGFRLALPCHPQLLADTGIPPIAAIGATDTIYAWFNSTTPATITFANGRYSPA